MAETVCLVMPAATPAAPAAPRAGRREPACDRSLASSSIAAAEAQLRKIEAQGRERARAPALASNAEIVARARFLVSESGGTLSVIAAVDRAWAEAGLPSPAPRGAAQEAAAANDAIVARAREMMAESGGTLSVITAVDRAWAEAGLPPTEPRGAAQEAAAAVDAIVTRARELMAESGGTLSVITAVDRASDEAAPLAAENRKAREQQAWERRMEQHDRVTDTLADTALALERRLMAHARELIAAARRAMADDPMKARELAIRAREAMAATEALYGKKPDHEPARRILQGARGRTA